MGKVKESLPDYVYNGNMDFGHYALKEEVNALIEQGIFEDKKLLKEFLEEVTPLNGVDYFAYVKDISGTYVNIRYDRDEYINALCCLSQHQLTLFYHLASFDGWIIKDHAKAVRCLYVDVDDICMKADETTKEDAVNFLKSTYNLTDEQLPRWCILSGNGMHLCYPIDEITTGSEKIRKIYTASLITFFQGDHSGLNIAHQFRCPESYNMKEEPIKGKLFKLNNSADTSIERLNWCLKSEEENENYKRSYYTRREEKRRATVKKNKELTEKFLADLGSTTIDEYLSDPSLSATERKIALKVARIQAKKEELLKQEQWLAKIEDRILNYTQEEYDAYIYSENSLPYLHLRKYDGYKPQNRSMNLLLDLHNFFIAHKGCLVSRDIFIYIIASIFKSKKFTQNDCKHWCKKYSDNEFKHEMYAIIKLIYKSKTTYHFSNKQIADSLCFTEEDIARSYCNFSEKRVINAKKVRNRNHYEKNLHKAGKLTNEERKEKQIKYLTEHPDATPEDAKAALGIGRTTFFTLKKELKLSSGG